MRMRRQILHAFSRGRSASHDWVHSRRRFHSLKIAIVARMIVRPENVRDTGIVGHAPFEAGLRIPRMKMIGGADPAKRAKRDPEVLMIA